MSVCARVCVCMCVGNKKSNNNVILHFIVLIYSSFILTIVYHKVYSNLYFVLDLSLDAVDSSGEQHIQIDYNIYKRRLDMDGNPIDDGQKESTL